MSTTGGVGQVSFLERWFAEQCDGDWEHLHGIKVETLALQDQRIPWRCKDRSVSDWLHYWSDGVNFEARCGPANPAEAIATFRSFAEGYRAH